MAETIKIGGELESTATGNVVAAASAIKDKVKNKYQDTINAETDATLTNHASAIQGLNSQNYVTVTATDQTTAATDVLPATGSADTIYRVGSWDGTQYDETCYSEYSWNGSAYVHISTKTQIGEVFDISAYHATGGELAKYADLTAALNGGANIPQSLQKGGMSIKFVQIFDNKYAQFRLMADEFTTDTTQWAIADEGVYVENPEFVRVILDNKNRILEAIRVNGTKLLPSGVEVNEKIYFEGNEATIIENPEFIEVKLDGAGHILWGIQKDGNIYFGAGVPQQVIDYINERIAELSLDEYEDIVAFLNGLEEGDKTLQDLLNEKVDKVEGKSLIDEDVADGVHYEENPEFIDVELDAENKILEATEKDGTKVFGGDVKVLGSIDINGVSYKVVSNPEWLEVVLDAEGRIICGIRTDGTFCILDLKFLDSTNEIKDKLSFFDTADSPEFLEVELDADDKVLGGRKVDGTKFENNDVKLNGNVTVGGSLEVDSVVIKNIEDPEGRSEITTDSEGKIISYRDSDGVKHEEVGIETDSASINHLNLTDTGMTEFQQALKNSGFQPGGGGDWSERENIELPEPKHYALLNIVVDSLPVNDSDVSEGYAQYYDELGNYFKLECSIEAQGQTSRIFAMTGGKGNYTLNLPKDVKFGSWVPQDSFHLKGNYKDPTRGILPTSYKWAYEFMDYLDAKPNRVLMDEDAITTTEATGDRITDWPSDARCLPDGFPVEIYINGEYWGLYSWQLKKHRKNYSMDKKDYTSFFLDADALMTGDYTTGIWNEGPKRWWNSFEIKNPKDMILENGQDYDDHGELIGPLFSVFDSTNWKYTDDYSTSEPVSDIWNAGTNYAVDDECWCYDEEIEWWRKFKAIAANQNRPPLSFLTNTNYDASNKKHKGSARTKSIIQSFAKKYLEVKGLIDANDIVNAKAKFNEYFDYNCCMLVYIFNCLMDNEDSVRKNTLWATYGDGKIAPMLWDLDGMYGHGWMGIVVREPRNGMWDNIYANANWPLKLFWTLYEDEIKAAYADLRRDGIIDMKAWKGIMYGQWVNRVGENALKRDIERWPETPSYRDSGINKDYWRAGGWTEDTNTYPIWDANTQYEIGDVVLLDIQPDIDIPNHHYYQKYTAKQQNTGECPVTKTYEHFPQIGGMYDSPKRMEKWMDEQIRVCDVKLGYNNI